MSIPCAKQGRQQKTSTTISLEFSVLYSTFGDRSNSICSYDQFRSDNARQLGRGWKVFPFFLKGKYELKWRGNACRVESLFCFSFSRLGARSHSESNAAVAYINLSNFIQVPRLNARGCQILHYEISEALYQSPLVTCETNARRVTDICP